jgi:hypothetical protein
MSAFDIAKRYLEQDMAAAVDPTDGRIVAVLICSHVLAAEIWFALDDNFTPDPGDFRAVFYADEIPLLKANTAEELREIHKVKVAMGLGSRLRQ